MQCDKCGGPAVRVKQTGKLSCLRQCDETARDELLRKELEGLTGALARLVDTHVPEGYLFTLILMKAGPNGAMAYASSGQRQDCISMLREMADKIDVDAGKPS